MNGGKREGSGKKPKIKGQSRNKDKTVKLSQQVFDYLSEVGSGIVEDVIRRTKDFKDWVKKQ